MTSTKIEWASKVWNPLAGCSLASPGCTNCYAMKMAGRLEAMGMPQYQGTTQKTKAGFVWTGQVNAAPESILTAPLRQKKPTDYFVNSMSDLFHPAVPDALIDRVFAVMALCPQHVFKILTKRPDRMREYMISRRGLNGNIGGEAVAIALEDGKSEYGGVSATFPAKAADVREVVIERVYDGLPNVWLGTSVEDQTRADERIPHLLATPAALRFLSMEPLLGPVDLTMIQFPNDRGGMECWDALDLHLVDNEPMPAGNCEGTINWVIVGGESGPGARPMHPDWARSLRDQCAAAGVPFFFKQWGAWLPIFEHPWNAIAAESCPDPAAQSPFDHVVWDGERWEAMNGCWDDSDSWYVAQSYSEPEQELARVGKKRAGRLLDGREHSDFPSASTRGVGSAGEPA